MSQGHIKWQQQKLLKVVLNITLNGFNNCHHQTSKILPVEYVSYRVAFDICPSTGGSGDPTGSTGWMNGKDIVVVHILLLFIIVVVECF